MTRDVRDAARFLTILAPPDPDDPYSATHVIAGLRRRASTTASPACGSPGRRTSVGSPPRTPGSSTSCTRRRRPSVELGARYAEPDLRIEDTFDLLHPDQRHSMAQVSARFRDYPDFFGLDDLLAELRADPQRWEQLCIYVKDRSLPPTPLEYSVAIHPDVRDRPIDHVEDVFRDYDLLLSPVISRPAFVCGEPNVTAPDYVEYTHIANCLRVRRGDGARRLRRRVPGRPAADGPARRRGPVAEGVPGVRAGPPVGRRPAAAAWVGRRLTTAARSRPAPDSIRRRR